MKKTIINDRKLVIHFRCNNSVLNEVTECIEQYLDGTLYPRKLSNGKYSVIDLKKSNRLVLKNDEFHLLSHEGYNNFVKR